MTDSRLPTWFLVCSGVAAALLLPVLAAWFYLGSDILLVYLEAGLSYCF